jgi:hypothetical protein
MQGPEHFAAIAARHFVRLREIPMLDPTSPIGANFNDPDHDDPSARPAAAPTLPSAEDHYRDACRLLGEAHGVAYNLGERRALIDAVEQHLRAGELALRIWPATPATDGLLLEWLHSMAQELARQRPVVDAAGAWFAALGETKSDTEAELAEAVRAWKAGE